MDLNRLQEILQRAGARRITVIGDLMLDEFVWGKVGRISPEAPVPVVEVTGESFYPGGAANVARNLREFVDRVSVIGIIGNDPSGRQLRELLAAQDIDTSNVVGDDDFRTIVKTRIIALHQQVVRVDREKIVAPSAAQIEKAVAAVRDGIRETDAIIFEDYGKGFVTSELVTQISREARAAGKIVAADPNPRHSVNWHGVTVVKPNRTEAFLAAGVPWRDPEEAPEKDVDLERAGEALLKQWETKYVLITLGEHGMMLFQKNETPHYIPTKARQVFDVSGAGDTAIALFTLGLVCGATPIEAAEIANYGSAVVVSKLGTATVTRDELIASFREDNGNE
ncbi:MAG TPA: PfkB family carbohydrate kinase [Candidatus Udaeobacter sp.]|jgi:D-beta-D-heptose 7-phosphate kinase/D-beta-D-heptose 1-phosphate adenosyltransferase